MCPSLRLVALLLPLLGCNRPATAFLADSSTLTAAPPELSFVDAPLGTTSAATLTLQNAGGAPVDVSLSVGPPFGLAGEATGTVAQGGELSFVLRYTPMDYDPASGTVTVFDGAGTSLLLEPVTATTAADSDADGHDAVEVGGDDCDDLDAGAHPGAVEVCGNDVDEDCDPANDFDCDGDGVPADKDCDDGDPTAYPGNPADGLDGVDNDCDVLVDEEALGGGELVFSEVAPNEPNDDDWVELCNVSGRSLPVAGFLLSYGNGSFTLDDQVLPAGGCVAWCAHDTGTCTGVHALSLDPASITLTVSAGAVELDGVNVPAGWGWAAGDVWGVDPGSLSAAGNNAAGAWCSTAGSQGTMNVGC